MTVGQLYMAIGKEDRLILSSLYDISIEVELQQTLIGYSAIMGLEVCSLSGHDGTYTAYIDIPSDAIAALQDACQKL